MKNVASLFTLRMQEELKKHLNIELSDVHDYSDDELEELYARITEDFPYEFGPNGELLDMGQVFEDMIDVFVLNKLPI